MEAHFSFNRRTLLQTVLMTAPIACWTASAFTPAMAAIAYTPVYFTPDEWRFIRSASDRLIPSNDDGPGALELDVPVFIDKQMVDPYGAGAYWYLQGPAQPDAPATFGYQNILNPREIYRKGIAAFDAWCVGKYNKPFASLDAKTQDEALVLLEKNEVKMENPSALLLFSQLLENVKEGYFADPKYGGNKDMGSWKMIGFPGARADFTDWMDKPGAYYPFGPVSIDGQMVHSGEKL